MNITVYCGSSEGNKAIYKEAAIAIGEWIARNKHTLVYGGGATGLMKVVADTSLIGGAKVIGVRPDFLSEIEPAHTGLSDFIRVETMTERKKVMVSNGDAYIALPGGLGTLEEISEVVSWAMIGRNDKPCVFFNADGYYDDLKNQYDKMVSSGFLTELHKESVLFSDSIKEIDRFVNEYKPPSMVKERN